MQSGSLLRTLLQKLHEYHGIWGPVATAMGINERTVRNWMALSDEELGKLWPKYRESILAAAREARIEEPLYDPRVALWNPRLSFRRNVNRVIEAPPLPIIPFRNFRRKLFGLELNSPFGSPASVITSTSDRVRFLARTGCDLITYKTVRSRSKHSHPTPNILLVLDRLGRLPHDAPVPPIVAADSQECDEDISSTHGVLNRYGMPSHAPEEWQSEVETSIGHLGEGQALIVSIVGTVDTGAGSDALVEDFARVAAMAYEAGARILEMNLSCPNTGNDGELFRDPMVSGRVAKAVRAVVPDAVLVAKIGYTSSPSLDELVAALAPSINGVAAINTLSAEALREGLEGLGPAWGIPGLRAGLSGAPIHGFAINCLRQLLRVRKEQGLVDDLDIIGIGGVTEPSDVSNMLSMGANAVQAATAFFQDAYFGYHVRRYLEEQYQTDGDDLEIQLNEEHWGWSAAVRDLPGLYANPQGMAIANAVWCEHEKVVREAALRGKRFRLKQPASEFAALISAKLRRQ